MSKIFVKDKAFLRTDFQPFMQDFVKACKLNGFESKPDLLPSYRFHVRSMLCRALLAKYNVDVRFRAKALSNKKFSKALLIASNGGMILQNAFPYFCDYKIVPMLWDVWPHSWENIYDNIKRFNITTVFVTVRSFSEKLNHDLNIHAHWIPEGIETSYYQRGEDLDRRGHNILEIGRKHPEYHAMLESMKNYGLLDNYQTSKTNQDGTLDPKDLAFPNFLDLTSALPHYKVMVTFPQCDSNPQRAGELETLTQRYWEAMLSRCVMIGRAPKELIDLIGYNPVVNVDWAQPAEQLQAVLNHISDYQDLVNHNYRVAQAKAGWSTRIETIINELRNDGYEI